MRFTLFHFLASSLVLVCAAAMPPAATAQPATPVTVRASILPIMDAGAFHVAHAKGFFAAEGLNVILTPSVSGAVGVPGLVSGSYDVAYTSLPSAYQAIQQGIDLRLISVGNRNDDPGRPWDNAGLVKLASNPISSGKDAEGKTIGVNARFNIQWFFAREWVRKTGGNPDRVNYREVQFPQMIDALKGKQVDAVFISNPFLTASLKDPDITPLGWPFRVILPGVRAAGYVVMGQYAEKQPQVVLAINRALVKGADWINANKSTPEFRSIMGAVTKMKPEVLSEMPVVTASSTIDEPVLKSMNALVDIMKANGQLEKDINLREKIYPPLR